MKTKTILSRHHPDMNAFRALARRRDASRVLLDGVHLVEEALSAGLRVTSVVYSTRLIDSSPPAARLAERLEHQGAHVHLASDAIIAAVSPVRAPSGIVAIADCPFYQPNEVFTRTPGLVVIAVDVQDPGNMGALIRAADAGGATGVITCGTSVDPFGWKALRGSMGSALRLPVIPRMPVEATVDAARGAGMRIFAAVPRGGRLLFETTLTGSMAFLLGGEGAGLSEKVTRIADERISIPMAAPVESLNVVVAGALLVYEAYRQRSAVGQPGTGARNRAPGIQP